MGRSRTTGSGRSGRVLRRVTIAAAALMALAVASSPASAIVGGDDATETYSFMASVQSADGVHTCGGSLIAPDWVVTAHHCVDPPTSPEDLRLRIGSTRLDEGGTVAQVAEIVLPPTIGGWNIPLVGLYPSHDIALLRLAEPVAEEPVTLASSPGDTGTPTRIIGWGTTCPGYGSACQPEVLQELETAVAADEACIAGFFNVVNETCYGDFLTGTGSCTGDSGGPSLVQVDDEWQLTGITSRTTAPWLLCDATPYIYTDATAWLDWLEGETDLDL